MWAIVSEVIRIGAPSSDLISCCKKELTFSNPEYAKKQRMGLYTGKTPKQVVLYEKDGKDYILPHGCLAKVQSMCDNVLYTYRDGASIDYGADIELYDYQIEAVTQLMIAGNGILQSPAGSGKTQMGLALITKLGLKALWITHTKDLLTQSKERAEMYIKSDLLGTITEGKVNIGEGITFATVQTLANIDLSRYRDTWDVIVVDECHRVAGSPTKITQFSHALNNLSARHKYGLSATVHRSDGLIKATYALLGNVVHVVPESAVSSRIMQVGVVPVYTGTEVSLDCLNTDGTLNYSRMINYLCREYYRFEKTVSVIADDCRGKSTLILSDRLEHLRDLRNALPWELKDRSVMVDGSMTSAKSKAERAQAIEDMRTGKKKYLFATYSLAKEGLDIPCLERLLLTTPHHDYAVITQSIGRIARKHSDKTDALVYDFVDDIPFCAHGYKKRKSIYRKNNCYFPEVSV